MGPQVSRVLLVEDEFMVAMLTEDMLCDLGYEIDLSVADLTAGLQAAATRQFDVGVLDINLRGSLSYPIADILIERGIPFIFASGYTAHGMDARYAQAPTIQKPFTMAALGQTLARALAAREAGHRNETAGPG